MATRYEDLDWTIERYDDLEPGTPVEARINDAAIPVGTVGTVVRTIAETGNHQCVFDLDTGARRVVAMCPDQIKPVGAPEVTETLRLVAAAHDPVQYEEADRQERRDAALAKLTTEEAKARRRAGLQAYHERRRAEKVAAEAEVDAPAADRRRGPRITGTPWTDEARAAQSERMKARHAARKAAEAEEVVAVVTPEEIEAMRTARNVPRTVRAVRAASAWDAQEEPTPIRREELEALVANPQEPLPQVVARNWRGEMTSAMRRVLQEAAGVASGEDLALMVEVIAYLERGAA